MDKSIGHRFVTLLVTITVLLGFAWDAEQPALSAGEAATLFSHRYPLAKFLPASAALELRHSVAQHTLFLPLAKRVRVKSALLHIEFTNSTALLEQRSQLRISLNEHVIAQVPLRPHQPEATADIRLPVALLQAGYNRIQFEVAQHYTLDCEDPAAPELWTQIDPVASTLALETELVPLTPTLAALGDLFDRKQWEIPRLHILTGTDALRDIHLRWGSLVTQGAALRQEYLPLQVTHGVAHRREPDVTAATSQVFPSLEQTALAGVDTVLVGVKEELAPYLSPDMLAQITNSYLAVHRLDSDPTHLLLVISGRDEAEVTRAATAFAFLNFSFPDTASMQVTDLQLPLLPDYAVKQGVQEQGVYPFSHFGFQTTTTKGINPEPLRFEVVFPPDLFAREDSVVELRLHMAYGAGLRADSALNVLLNDHFETVVALDQPTGVAYRNYKLSVPLRSFQPGRNTLTFSAQMAPSHTGKCTPLQEENLLLTLFSDSSLTLPSASHFVRLPDFQLLAKAAFPYAVRSDGSTLTMQVTNHESNTIASAWMVMGKLAQKIGTPLHQAELSFQLPVSEKNLIVVGPVDTLDARLVAAAPLSLGREYRVPYPTLPVLSQRDPPFFSWSWINKHFPGLADASDLPTVQPTSAQFLQVSALGRNSVATMMESPFHAQKTVLLITAADTAQLSHNVNRLLTPELWENLQGDVAVWRDEPQSLTWQRAGLDYHVGKVSVTTHLEYRFSQSPWVWTLTVLALLGVFAVLTRILLFRFRHKHHGDLSTEESNR